jgi:endonuclease YncB( thermonuclease family)
LRQRLPSWRGLLIFAGIVAAAYLWAKIARSASIDAKDIRVIDGDTIRVGQKRPDIRLIGFNAPETRRAKCDAERELGGKATSRVREIVRTGKLDLQLMSCNCPPGTEGTPACNYGRQCGVLRSDGRDLRDILIEERLAVAFDCHGTRCPATPRPWCRPEPKVAAPAVATVHNAKHHKGRGGCGSRGGAGYRLPNGKCASRRHR